MDVKSTCSGAVIVCLSIKNTSYSICVEVALYHWRPVVLIVASGSYTLSKLHPAQLRFLFLLPNGLNGLSIPALQQPVLLSLIHI